MTERRWEITAAELSRLRAAIDGIVGHADSAASLLALANWALALIDAAAIVIAVQPIAGDEARVAATAGLDSGLAIGTPLGGVPIARTWLTEGLTVDGRLVGRVYARPRRGRRWNTGDGEILGLIAAQASMALAQERADVRIAVARAREEAALAERARLARELHDVTAQQLVAIGRRLDILRMEASGLLATDIDSLHDQVDHAVIDVRRISRDLRPTILEDLGLTAAIEALAADTRRVSGQTVSVAVAGERGEIAPATELAIYRIAQELIANAARHAAAAHIWIHLTYAADSVALRVEDDGRGFAIHGDASTLVRAGGLGLAGVAERVAERGGSLKIDTAPGRGTRIRVRVSSCSDTMPDRERDHD